jgi:hypothetical protein
LANIVPDQEVKRRAGMITLSPPACFLIFGAGSAQIGASKSDPTKPQRALPVTSLAVPADPDSSLQNLQIRPCDHNHQT